MKPNDKKRTAFITGASRGIGLSIARYIAPMCTDLIVASKTKSKIMAAARRLNVETECEIHPIWGDLSEPRRFATSAARLVAKTTNKIDFLVLNAGYFIEGSLAEIGDHDFERNMIVNCQSAHYVVAKLLPFLSTSGSGRIVLVGSTAAYEPYPLVPTYGMAKWGLRGYAINLRRELMKRNIGVTFISPGGTWTDMWKGAELPPNRLLRPEDIAKLVAATLTLSNQAVVEELIVRPMLGDIHE